MAAWCLSREWALFIIERIRAGSCLSLLASDWSQLWLSWPLIGQQSSGYNKCRLLHLRILVSPVSARISASEDLSALSSLWGRALSSQQPPASSAASISLLSAWHHSSVSLQRDNTLGGHHQDCQDPVAPPQERYYTLMVDVIWSHLSTLCFPSLHSPGASGWLHSALSAANTIRVCSS